MIRVGQEERIDPRGRARAPEPWVLPNQRFFPLGQPELAAELWIGHRGLQRTVKGAEQRGHASTDALVLIGREKPRPQDRADGAVAEEKTAPAQEIIELRLRIGGDLVGQQVVVAADRVLQAHGAQFAGPGATPAT